MMIKEDSIMKGKKWNLRAKAVSIILGIALVFIGFFSLVSIQNLQGDARVINYAGIVRGAAQRLTKKELNHVPDDALIKKLDGILNGLAEGSKEYRLIRMDCPEFQGLVGQMQQEWVKVKAEIMAFRAGGEPDRLFEVSESFFELADRTVSAAEFFTEKSVEKAQFSMTCLMFIFAFLALASGIYVSRQQKKEDLLREAEERNRKKSEELNRKLQEILVPMNEISELMYISDMESYDLLFINQAGRETFHVDDVTGKKCYQVLQGREAPCPFCTTPLLKEDEIYTWEMTNPITGRHYLYKDRMVEWNGRPARCEIAFDMTEAENEKIELQNMLDSEMVIIESIRQLYQNHDLSKATSFMLEQVGKSLDVDRAYIFSLEGEEYNNTFEWCRDGIEPQIDELQHLPVSMFAHWLPLFEQREYVIIEDLEKEKEALRDGYEMLHLQNIERLVLMPLEREGKLDGCIGVDNPPPDKLQNAVTVLQTLRYFLMLARHRAEGEEELARMSYYDRLTSFYNRNRYTQDIDELSGGEYKVGIVYLDVNGLKEINDQFGHAAGDETLKACAKNMREVFPRGSFYRIGGDEFVIICKDTEKDEFEDCVRKLKLSLAENPLCKAAVGDEWVDNSADIQSAILLADEKMYANKKEYYYRHPSRRYRHLNDDMLHLMDLNVLKEKLEEGCFIIYLQPKVAAGDRKVVGAEALVRYQLDDIIVPPMDFIPLLEEMNLISHVDFFSFEYVCKLLVKWRSEGRPLIPVSVNFSRYSLLEPECLERLEEICGRYGLDKKWVGVEITENFKGANSELVQSAIDRIKQAGFSVSIDDFGVEFSNLFLVTSVKFDVLKIDRSLVKDIVNNERARTLLEAMTWVCRKMDVRLIAEGVEEETQMSALEGCGIEVVQGFLFGKPVPVEEFERQYMHPAGTE